MILQAGQKAATTGDGGPINAKASSLGAAKQGNRSCIAVNLSGLLLENQQIT